MSRKDTSFYKKGNQIAGSLLTGWEPCESDLGGPFFMPQPQCAVGFVHRTAGWLAGHRRAGPWWAVENAPPQEESLPQHSAQQPALRLGLDPVSACISVSQQIRKK